MFTTQTDIETRIISIIAKCTDLPPDKFDFTHWQEPLTGSLFNLFAVDLVYVLFEIEKEFEIQISPNALTQYKFSSINDICSAVKEILGHT